MSEPFRAAALVIVRDISGRILLVRSNRRAHRWELPGGSVERGESPMAAAHREVTEETGLRIDDLRMVGLYHGTIDGLLRIAFSAVAADSMAQPTAVQDEIDEVGWFEPTGLPRPMPVIAVQMIRDSECGEVILTTVQDDRELIEARSQ